MPDAGLDEDTSATSSPSPWRARWPPEMDAAEIAKRIDALEAGLAAKASRIADLEARVSILEAENASLRMAMANGQAMDHTAKKGPSYGRLEEDFGKNKQTPVDIVGGHADVVNDVTEGSDGGEQGMAVDFTNERSLLADPTPWERTAPVVTGQSGTEDEIGDTGGGGGSIHSDDNVGLEDDDVSIIPSAKKRAAARMITSDSEDEDTDDKDGKVQEELGVTVRGRRSLRRGIGDSVSDDDAFAEDVHVVSLKHVSGVAETWTENDEDGGIPVCESDGGSIHRNDNVSVEDDDVSVIPDSKKRRAARMITSDSEDEDMNDKDGKVQEELGVTPSRKRLLRGLDDSGNDNGDDAEDIRLVSLNHVSSVAETGTENEEDEDDSIPIRQVIQTRRGKKSSRDDGELGEINGCSIVTTKRSAKLVKTKAEKMQVAQCGRDFVEPNECLESEDDSEQSDSMHEFINDEDCSENSSEESAEPAEHEEPDSEVNYKDVMASIGCRRNANAKDWEYEAEMLSAFAEQPELCFKAVCALYRKQTDEEQSEKASKVHNGQGFSQLDAVRGSHVAEFLLDGDTFGPPKKTVHDLEIYDPDALEFCEKIAARYSKQLFAIYQNKEDPYFP